MLWSNEKEDITLLSVKGDFSASLSSLGKFTDITESTLGEVPEFKDQFYRGQDYWTSRIEMLTGIDVGGWQGVSVADVNIVNLLAELSHPIKPNLSLSL